MSPMFDWLKGVKTMAESDYPYVASKGSCNYDYGKTLYNTKGYVNVQSNSIAALEAAVAQQPVSVAVDAASSNF